MPTATIDPIITQLAALRREKNIPAQTLAIRCGFTPTQIALYESGARTPDITRLRRWAIELGVTIRAEGS